MYIKFNKKIFSLLVFLCHPNILFAETYIDRTRIIINERERDETFTIKNSGKNPALMQLWIDKNDTIDRPELIKVPFLLEPPIFRLEEKNSRVIRIQLIKNGYHLDPDKESIFWLNCLEIPPKPADNINNKNIIQVAVRTRIKLLYRPKSIERLNLSDGIKKLEISKVICLVSNTCIRIINKSPLHITLQNIELNDKTLISKLPNEGLIPPLSQIEIPLTEKKKYQNLHSLIWIDDYGNKNKFINSIL